MELRLIVATDEEGGIGRDELIPWKIPEDLQRFKEKTINSVIVMGRKTFESLPGVLPGRIHLVLTSNPRQHESSQVEMFGSWDALLTRCWELSVSKTIYFIGGTAIYQKALELGASRIYRTRVSGTYGCDAHFPEPQGYTLIKKSFLKKIEGGPSYVFETYTPSAPKHPETQYLRLLRDLLFTGERRATRNAVTWSSFGHTLEFDISESFPLLTTKRMHFKSIAEELFWFIRGQTDACLLDAKGVKIWNGNSSRQALDALGLPYREGDCGPVYGHQLRFFNAPYVDCETDYSGQGVDQLAEVIRQIRDDPTSRRILFTMWNPCHLKQVALPACHVLYQFYVDSDGGLSCQMYQRSADVFLGLPFNIASTALLVYLIAHYTGKKPKRVRVCLGDAHIYEAHREVALQQMIRTPFQFCKLVLKEMPETIERVELSNIDLVGYRSGEALRTPMIV